MCTLRHGTRSQQHNTQSAAYTLKMREHPFKSSQLIVARTQTHVLCPFTGDSVVATLTGGVAAALARLLVPAASTAAKATAALAVAVAVAVAKRAAAKGSPPAIVTAKAAAALA